MSGFSTISTDNLIRSELWSKNLKQLLLDDLYAMKFVRVLSDFPDGTLINIPSLGEAHTSTFAEGQAVKYSQFDTGNYQFSFDQYIYSATAISEKFKRDSFYSSEVIASFLPRQHRAIMEGVEARILSRGPSGQTPNDLNVINEASHRWVGTGTGNSMAVKDFARAIFALQKAQVPQVNLVAIVDPSVAYSLSTQANMVNLMSPQPQWEDVVRSGMMTGFKFKFNIYGVDVYVSNYLQRGLSETIDGVSVTNGVANLIFSAVQGDVCPIIGGFRQMPTVYSEFNKDLQQTEYMTITEYGFQLYRPENMITIITDTTVVD